VAVARNRLLLLGGAVALAAIVVVVVIVLAGSGGSSDASTTTTANAAAAKSIFAGVPQRGDVLGNPNAPVTLEVFEDPQCPYCRQWNLDTLETVVNNYVRPGRVKLRYRGIVVIGVNSVAGLRAIYAAGNQGKLWNMVDALYVRQGPENSGWITVPTIKAAAKAIGASPARVIDDADSAAVTKSLNASQVDAARAKVGGTPTFVVVKPLGTPQQLQLGGLEPDQFTPALDAALQ
jgi:protein-disulfide isomerase